MRTLLCLLVLSLCIVRPACAEQMSLPDLIERLQPSVVNISTTHLLTEDEDFDNGLAVISSNPNIQRYFAPHNPQQLSLGSGFVVDADGYIVTNAHVIDKAEEILVTLADGRQLSASVKGSDDKTDLALIKVDTTDKLPTVKLGNSDAVRVGDQILTIGNPFGLGGSVSTGIVSAKSRDIDAGAYDNFIQTDASINQGSSGGPMFNMNGEVIGICSTIYSTTGGSMGIGFAEPINLAKFVISELKSKGKVERGWLGLKIQQSAQDEITVSSISENSPAQRAGIEAGDIIRHLNEYPVGTPKEFSRRIAETPIGSKIHLEISRNGQARILTLDVEAMPAPPAAPTQEQKTEAELAALEFAELTPEDAVQNGLAADARGVIIKAVAAGSDAELKGVKVGDVVTEIDRKPVVSPADAAAFLAEARRENNRPVLLLINNNNIPHFATVKL